MIELNSIIESLVFSAGEPLKISMLVEKLLDVTKKDVEQAIATLKEKYGENSGIQLLEFNGKLQFCSNPKFGEINIDLLAKIKQKALSKTLIEVLSIIAYKQPISKPDIEKIRDNINCDYALQSLYRLNLIEHKGRGGEFGRAILYGTTDEFLKRFELKNIKELPDYRFTMAKLKEIGDQYKRELFREVELSEEFPDGKNSPNSKHINAREELDKINEKIRNINNVEKLVNSDLEVPDFLQGQTYVNYDSNNASMYEDEVASDVIVEQVEQIEDNK